MKKFKKSFVSSRIGEKSLRILVYEHVSGGGFAVETISPDVLSEGFSMLRTLISDFKSAGHKVTTMLDSRIKKLNPPIQADSILSISSSQEKEKMLQKISGSVDAVYVIAPETDDVLRSHVELIEQMDAASLNCSASAIKKVVDKASLYTHLRHLGASTPMTHTFSIFDNLIEIKKTIRDIFNFPLIFKPSSGVSCSGLSVVKNENQVVDAVKKIKKESSSNHFLVQELIDGAAASVSLFVANCKAMPVSLNRQYVATRTPRACSNYTGGSVPFDNALQTEAFEVSKNIIESFPDLRGYVGVDFVLTEDEAVALEINPRLTTSYIGLRTVSNFNLAQAIINAVVKNELPNNIHSCGCTYFSKLETVNPRFDILTKFYSMNDVVSPPFPISENGVASAIIVSRGSNLKEAKSKFSETKKHLLKTIGRGIK